MIYFVLDPARAAVKIGHTRSPSSFQKKYPAEWCLLRTEVGDRAVLTQRQMQFRGLRRPDGWYWFTGSLTRYLHQKAAHIG